MILNLKYEEIIKLVQERIEIFFEKYEKLKDNELPRSSEINCIFKKVLFETNKFKDKTRILLISNIHSNSIFQKDYFYDQKYIFLCKSLDIVIDSIQIGEVDSVRS